MSDPEAAVGERRAVGLPGEEAARGHGGLERLHAYDAGGAPVRVQEGVVLHSRGAAEVAAAATDWKEPVENRTKHRKKFFGAKQYGINMVSMNEDIYKN